jgi:hypothetical protein
VQARWSRAVAPTKTRFDCSHWMNFTADDFTEIVGYTQLSNRLHAEAGDICTHFSSGRSFRHAAAAPTVLGKNPFEARS